MKKILIALFVMLIVAFSIVGMTNFTSDPGTDIDQQQEAVPTSDNHQVSIEIKKENT